VTPERFEQGLTLPQYLEQMRMNRERFVQLMQAADRDGSLTRPGRKLNVLVITEDWCGDGIDNLPVLARMLEGHPHIQMRVFLRDRNPDVMEQFLKHGRYRSIPVFAFLDEAMNEVARFTERAPVAEPRRAPRSPEWRRGVIEHLKGLLQV
jgi:Thioredoxin